MPWLVQSARRGRQAALSLVELVVALAVVSVIAALAGGRILDAYRLAARQDAKLSLGEIKRRILLHTDCNATFRHANISQINPGGACPSTSAAGGQTGSYLPLYRLRKDGSPELLFPASVLGTGYSQVGTWTIRASCSSSEKSLVIRAAQIRPDGSFRRDPVTKAALDWDASTGLIFGGSGAAMPLCFTRDATQAVAVDQPILGPAPSFQAILGPGFFPNGCNDIVGDINNAGAGTHIAFANTACRRHCFDPAIGFNGGFAIECNGGPHAMACVCTR